MDRSDPSPLLQRFPGLSEDQIREAHAYTYGGAVIEDLGYYPFGSTEFSNLVHMSGAETSYGSCCWKSQDVNEYAFALGAPGPYQIAKAVTKTASTPYIPNLIGPFQTTIEKLNST